MYPSVKKVESLEEHVLLLEFSNGESGMLDMKPFLGFGVFRRLQDLAAFKRARAAFDTIEWDCGVDLDPEFVYGKCRIVQDLSEDASEDHRRSTAA